MNLTNSQLLIWAGQELHPDVPLYNMVLAFRIDGPVDADRLHAAIQSVVDRSDALRTVFERDGGVPSPRVLPPFPVDFERVDFSTAPGPETAARDWMLARARRPFPAGRPLFDTSLLRVAPDIFVWYLNQHHLITDGWSTAVLYRTVAEEYERSGDTALLPDLPAYASYAEYERAFRSSPLFAKAESFWKERLRSAPAPVRLRRRPLGSPPTTRTDRLTLDIDHDRAAALRALEPELRSLTGHLSLFTLFAALLFALLHRLSGEYRLSLGAPSHNRRSPQFKNTLGVFIEVLPMQIEIEPGETFASLLRKVRDESGRFLRYALPGTGTPDGNRSTNVVLNYIHASFTDFAGLPMTSEWIHPGHGDSHHHLRLQIHDFDHVGTFRLHFDANVEVFDETERLALPDHYLRLIDELIADREQPIAAPARRVAGPPPSISVGPNTAQAQPMAAHAWPIAVDRELSSDRTAEPATVLRDFLAVAKQRPDAIALSSGERTLRYDELDARSNQLARLLRKRGIEPGSIVAVQSVRSIETVVAVLAILKAGGAFLPIDPSSPLERMERLLMQSGSRLRVVPKGRPRPVSDIACIHVEDDWSAAAAEAATPVADEPRSEDLAYVIYTSGSTGEPKGVMIEHGALAHYVAFARNQYVRGRRLDFALFTPLTFDLTLTSIFVPLTSGGRVVIYQEDDPAAVALLELLRDDAVDVVKLTPSHLSLLAGQQGLAPRLKVLIVGGEDFKTQQARLAESAFAGAPEIYNEYGPTEATVGCMIHRYDPSVDTGPSVPIGRAIPGTSIRLLDDRLRPVAAGDIGEICIGGPGLARGYLGRPDLTAERFFPDPDDPQSRLYRTGDFAVADDSGILRFRGRRDDQLKIRGHRVEPGEIEAALLTHPAVTACVVGPLENGETELQHCARCGLPSNYPGVTFDETGVCSLCTRFDRYRDRVRAYFGTMDQLDALLSSRKGRGDYDCLVLLSGGKDSTYALCRIAELGVRVLAFTLDNGYLSEHAKANIRRVTEHLGVDHVFGTTQAMPAIFRESLKQFSNVCNGCFKALYTLGLRLACDRGIPFIVTGLSRGQFFETRLTEDLFLDDSTDADRIEAIILEARRAYHRADDGINRLLEASDLADGRIFDEVQVVDFYRYCDVGLDEMMTYLARHVPWIRPSDTGRSTNCLINEVGIFVHKRERGYHNYAFPYSWDVRMGHKRRDAALAELDDEPDPERVSTILQEIGYEPGAENHAQDAELHTEHGAKLDARPDGALDVEHDRQPDAVPEAKSESDTAGPGAPPELQLVAHYVGEASPRDLRVHLRAILPEYMIPAKFIRLDHLPLTAHQKVDRSKLPMPTASEGTVASTRAWAGAGAYHPPETPAEERIAAIWSEVLGVAEIGVDDDFMDLGGHSLQAIQVLARVNRAFGVDLSLRSAFEASTIRRLAALVEDAIRAEVSALSAEEISLLTQQEDS